MRYFYSILGIIVGVLYIKYNDKVTRATGSISWAEKWFGNTYTFHKFLGVVVIVISILSITGTFQWFITEKLGPLFGANE